MEQTLQIRGINQHLQPVRRQPRRHEFDSEGAMTTALKAAYKARALLYQPDKNDHAPNSQAQLSG